ncbi:MAG: exopolysaccharide biosynthesis polyprenyl glycosylphosphotransferase [Candidatus Eremiobacteraeota bacterium]|jgi:lipopolysaccharide/colanic/teichoic acid biosynthesis glycosyltransferase|nr:exopolysaccharide biosynthesis polyprenyl glycosylphosphotransferase [Candidatus Eremiobacteraeota bacterium]
MTAPVIAYRENVAYRRRKRALDLIIGACALLVALPILAIAAIAIRLEDGGAILFRQRRVGRFGRVFTIYKLRTMSSADCVDALSPTSGGDARVTRVGAILRKTSIDELPQLFNVLRGDMSVVGPRPEMPFIVKRYEPWQHLRHLATPGITGLWQTTCRSRVPLHRPEATQIDLEYVRTASTGTDGRIVLRTFRALLHAGGAY